MIANISPALIHAEETHNTLKYANRAKNIRITLEKNQIDVDYHISQYPLIIAQLQSEIEQLKESSANIGLSEEGHYILEKINNLLQKVKSKEFERLDVNAKLRWNEWRIDHFNALSLETEVLHEQNVKLRHNQSELQIAVERYTALIKNLLKKSKDCLPLSSSEYLEKEQLLGAFKMQLESKEYECQLLKSQSQKLSGMITDFIKSKTPGIIKQEKDADGEILYDTCTDESDVDTIKNQNVNHESDQEAEIFYTPTKNDKSQEEVLTAKAKRFQVPLDSTPLKRRTNETQAQNSPVIKKLKKRRESMIPTIKGRESLVPLGTPRRSRRLSKLPLNAERSLRNHEQMKKC